MFKRISRAKAPQLIIQQIRGVILRGDFAPGERLPTSEELMDQFSVSKATLREALRALEYMGLIDIRKGAKGGIYVREVDRTVPQESLINFFHFQRVSVENLSEVRKVLEPYAARVAATAISAEELEQLKSINENCKAILAAGGGGDINRDLVEFHRVIAGCTGNPVLVFILAFVEDLLQETKNLLRPDERFFRAVVQAHERICEALTERDPDRAFAEMYKDVCVVEEYLVSITSGSDLMQARVRSLGTD